MWTSLGTHYSVQYSLPPNPHRSESDLDSRAPLSCSSSGGCIRVLLGSVDKHLQSTYYVVGTLLGGGDTKEKVSPCTEGRSHFGGAHRKIIKDKKIWQLLG